MGSKPRTPNPLGCVEWLGADELGKKKKILVLLEGKQRPASASLGGGENQQAGGDFHRGFGDGSKREGRGHTY